MTTKLLIAGFGGQGVLFIGKFLAYAGLIEDREVCWMPSYGPEVRGGTSNCGVTLSDEPIGSPVVDHPDILIALNLPSLDKFEGAVENGGSIYVDSSLIERKIAREDVKAFYIPATKLARDTGLSANMIMLGYLLKTSNVMPFELAEKVIEKIVPPTKQHLIEGNLKGIEFGYNYCE